MGINILKKSDDEFSKFLYDSSVFLIITFIAVYVSLYLYHVSIKTCLLSGTTRYHFFGLPRYLSQKVYTSGHCR